MLVDHLHEQHRVVISTDTVHTILRRAGGALAGQQDLESQSRSGVQHEDE